MSTIVAAASSELSKPKNRQEEHHEVKMHCYWNNFNWLAGVDGRQRLGTGAQRPSG